MQKLAIKILKGECRYVSYCQLFGASERTILEEIGWHDCSV